MAGSGRGAKTGKVYALLWNYYLIVEINAGAKRYFASGTFSAPSAVCVNIEKKAVTAYIGAVITIVIPA